MSTKGAATLCERLADYACGLEYERIAPEAIARVKGVMLHDLVVGILGSESDEGVRAVALV